MKIHRLRKFVGVLGLVYSLSIFLLPIPVLGATENYTALTPLAFTANDKAINSTNNFNGCTKEEISGKWDSTTKTRTTPPSCLPKYLRYVYNTGILLAGFLAVFSIVRGGFTLLFTDSILGHSEAKGIILRAIGGLLIVYSSFILMNQINPQLGKDLNLSLDYKQIKIKKPPVGLVPSLFREAADARETLATFSKNRDQLALDEENNKEARTAAESLTDPVAKQQALAEVTAKEAVAARQKRALTVKQTVNRIKSRTLADFNSQIALPGISGNYSSGFAFQRKAELEESIVSAETVLYDNGDLASYATKQLNDLDPTLAEARNEEEKKALEALDQDARDYIKKKREQLKGRIKAECDNWRKANHLLLSLPSGCENYQ